jgi:PAS domain S-box-containing protein
MSSSQTSGDLHDPDRLRLRQIEAVLDGMVEGLLLVDASGAVIRANPAAIRIVGDLDSFEVRTFDGRLIPDDDRPARRALRGEAISRLELQIHRKDTGGHRIVSHSATPVCDEAGKISHAVVILHDITEQKQTEAELQRVHDALRESQLRFRRLADSNMLGIAVFNLDGRVLDANAEHLRLMDRTQEDLAAGLYWKDCTPQEWHAADQRALADLRATGVARAYEKEFLHNNGRRIPVLLGASMVDEAAQEGVAFTIDLSERKEAIEALSRSNKDLQQFAFVASHDLQEPLRMVSSYTQLLARKYQGQLGPEADEYIRYAVDGANRMSALIRDLLHFSRFGFAELRPPQSTELSVMVDWALLSLRTAVQESGAEITFDGLPTVSVDQSQMPQVFQNLIGNAIKYRRAEEVPRIQISANREGDEWIIAVQDNGIGFDPQHAGLLFGVFKRLHGREYPGSGIGLAICKRIVERHGGRIWATSEPDQGSTFYFTLLAD